MARTVTENIGTLVSDELKERIDAYRRKLWDDTGEEISRAEFLRRAAEEKLQNTSI